MHHHQIPSNPKTMSLRRQSGGNYGRRHFLDQQIPFLGVAIQTITFLKLPVP